MSRKLGLLLVRGIALMLMLVSGLARVSAVELDPPGAGTGLHAEYRGNMDFTGGVVEVIDPLVDHAWGVGVSPIAGIEAKTYSIIWTGRILARSTEAYKIITLCDDGVRVSIDGVSVINNTSNNWDGTTVRRNEATVNLVAGSQHDIVVRYYQNRGTATMRLLWSTPSIPEQVIPTSQLFVVPPVPATLSAPGTGTGLHAWYWGNMDFTGGVVEVDEPGVDHFWSVSESPIAEIEPKTYSIAWKGLIRARSTEHYFLTTLADDGVRVVVDGATVINDTSNNWDGTTVRRNTADLDWVADSEHTIEIWYNQNRGTATIQLLWSTPTIPEEIVPSTQLSVIPPVLATLSPPADGTGLHAWYWGNMNFAGGVVEALDPLVDWSWASNESPIASIEPQTYSITWSGKLRARSTEAYVISTLADDGVRVVIDGVTVINDISNNWDGTKVRRNGAVLDFLADSDHTIEISYYQNRGTATMRLLWSTPTIAEEVIPTSQLFVIPPTLATLSAPGAGNGLCSTWWDNSDFTNQVSMHVDPLVDHAWGLGVPPEAGMGTNYYSVTWTGKVLARSSERYFLSTLSDDGVRVVVDGMTVINDTSNNWDGTKVRRNGVALDWAADSYHSIEIWYYQTRGTATMQLLWSTPTIAEQIIPTSQLFPATTVPEVTWSNPDPITYPEVLGPAQLNATAAVPGTFTYEPPTGTALPTGDHVLSVTFVAQDQASCANVTLTVPLTVLKATPSVTWTELQPITWGVALSVTQLAATTPVPGTWTYTPPAGTIVEVGTSLLTADFVPADSDNYETASLQVSLTVLPVMPVLTWAAPQAIPYGTALSATQLAAQSSIAAGTFTYDPPAGTILPVGVTALSVTFVPTDAVHYTQAQLASTIEVVPAMPVITWPAPAAIVEGTALSAIQLNASTTVPGTFQYTPDLGAILPMGNNLLSVAFTPTNSVTYLPGTATVTQTVLPGGGGGGGGGGEEPSSTTPPQVTIAITGGLTGDEQGDVDGVLTFFSKDAALTVTVTVVPAVDSPVAEVRILAGETVIDLGAGSGTAQVVLAEGTFDVSAEAVTTGGAVGTSASLPVLIDRTPPVVIDLVCLPAIDSEEAPIALEPGPFGTRDYRTLHLGHGPTDIVADWRQRWTLPVYTIGAFAARVTVDDPILKEVTYGWDVAPFTVAQPIDEEHPETVSLAWAAGPSAGDILLQVRAMDRSGNESAIVTYPVVYQHQAPTGSQVTLTVGAIAADRSYHMSYANSLSNAVVDFVQGEANRGYRILNNDLLLDEALVLGADPVDQAQLPGAPEATATASTWTLTDSCGNQGEGWLWQAIQPGYLYYHLENVSWNVFVDLWNIDLLQWENAEVAGFNRDYWSVEAGYSSLVYRGADPVWNIHEYVITYSDEYIDWGTWSFAGGEGWSFLTSDFDQIPPLEAPYNYPDSDPELGYRTHSEYLGGMGYEAFALRDFGQGTVQIETAPPAPESQRAILGPMPIFNDDVGTGTVRRVRPAVLTAPPSWAPGIEGGQPWNLAWSDQVLGQGEAFGMITQENDYEGPWNIGVRRLDGASGRWLSARLSAPGTLTVEPTDWGDDRRGLAGALSLTYTNPGVSIGGQVWPLSRPWTPDWVSVCRLDNDVQATGTRVTLRITGAFAENGVVPSQADLTPDAVRFIAANDSPVSLPANDPPLADESDKIRITGMRLIPDPEHWQASQLLEVDVIIGANVPAALYHVDLKVGGVKSYSDALSQAYAGANGAHRMKGALAIYTFDLKPVWKNEDGVIAEFTGNQATTVAIPEVQAQIVGVNRQSDGSIAFRVTGTIRDKLSETASTMQGAVSSFAIFLNGKKTADYPVQYGAGSPPWTQRSLNHAFDIPLTLESIRQGTCVVRVETTNAAGNIGFVNLDIPINRVRVKGGAQSIGASLILGLKVDAPNTVTVYRKDVSSWNQIGLLTKDAGGTYIGELTNFGGAAPMATITIANGAILGSATFNAAMVLAWPQTEGSLKIEGDWPLLQGFNAITYNTLSNGAAFRSDDMYLYTTGDPTEISRSARGNFVPILFKYRYKHPLSQQRPTVKINGVTVTFEQE